MIKPFFSVVVPSYNRAELICTTINSILGQDYKNFEIIIIDDGSKDNTEEVIQDAFGQLSNVRYYKKENEERGRARNFGINKALGQYIVFFDSDDIMLVHYLSTLHQVLVENELDFVAVKYITVNDKGLKVNDGNSKFESRYYTYKDFLKGNFLACNFTIRKDNKHLKDFENDRSYAILEDWMFLLENLKTNQLYLIDKVCLHMLAHDGRSMVNNQLVIDRRLRANTEMINRLKLNNRESKFINGYSYLFCGIHAYLDNKRSQSFKFIKQSIKELGFKKEHLLLFIKNIVGYKVISNLKNKL